jgi:quercetin dioxygenase-like cupin family protein
MLRNVALALTLLAGTAAMAADAPPAGTSVKPQFSQAIANLPGKVLTSVVVEYAPGGKSASHHHAPSAFIYAYVLSGAIRSQVDDEPVKIYHAGENWFEQPGAHHKISENASATEPARLLAVFVVDAADKALTTPDVK